MGMRGEMRGDGKGKLKWYSCTQVQASLERLQRGPELSGWEAGDVMVEAGAGARCQEDVIKCVRSENRALVE